MTLPALSTRLSFLLQVRRPVHQGVHRGVGWARRRQDAQRRGVLGGLQVERLRHGLQPGRLAGWPVGRLAGWQVGRLVGWSVGRLVGWLDVHMRDGFTPLACSPSVIAAQQQDTPHARTFALPRPAQPTASYNPTAGRGTAEAGQLDRRERQGASGRPHSSRLFFLPARCLLFELGACHTTHTSTQQQVSAHCATRACNHTSRSAQRLTLGFDFRVFNQNPKTLNPPTRRSARRSTLSPRASSTPPPRAASTTA